MIYRPAERESRLGLAMAYGYPDLAVGHEDQESDPDPVSRQSDQGKAPGHLARWSPNAAIRMDCHQKLAQCN